MNKTAEKLTQREIAIAGTEALFTALGAVNATRFLRQFDHGSGDYTQERQRWADDVTFDQLTAGAATAPLLKK